MKNDNQPSKIDDLIKNRRTVRKFSQEQVPMSLIHEIIDIAKWAPCPNNLQPWKFIPLQKDDEQNRAVIKLLEEKAKQENIGVSLFVKDAIKILKTAPILMYVFNTRVVSDKYKVLGETYVQKAVLFEHQSISAAIQNLLLSAFDKEIGTVWLGSPIFFKDKIESFFKTKYELVAVIGMGYYVNPPKITKRYKLDDIMDLTK